MDADGYDDLVIADSSALYAAASGAFYVQRGQAGLTTGTVINWRGGRKPDFTLFLNHESYQLTDAFAVGDYDGDGINDLAVGGLDYWEPGGRGVVHLLRGPVLGNGATRDLATDPADLTINGRRESTYSFGEYLTFGDLNHDGRADLVVGHPYLISADTKGAVFLFFGAEFASQPAEWNLADTPADARIETGSDGRFQTLGYPLLVGDYNDDGQNDLAIADPAFGAQAVGAVFFIDGMRLMKRKTIDLTESPADLTVIGPTDLVGYGLNFRGLTLAGPSLESGSSFWFANPDAGESAICGEVWQLSQDQLTESAVLQLNEVVPPNLYSGIAGAGYGRDLLIGQFDDNEERDLAVAANFLLLPGDEGKYRGAVFVYLDQLPAPLPADDDVDDDVVDDDTLDDDTTIDDDAADDDTSPVDNDDGDDDDEEQSCGC